MTNSTASPYAGFFNIQFSFYFDLCSPFVFTNLGVELLTDVFGGIDALHFTEAAGKVREATENYAVDDLGNGTNPTGNYSNDYFQLNGPDEFIRRLVRNRLHLAVQ